MHVTRSKSRSPMADFSCIGRARYSRVRLSNSARCHRSQYPCLEWTTFDSYHQATSLQKLTSMKSSNTTPSPVCILINGDAPTNISIHGSSKQSDARTLLKLSETSSTSSKSPLKPQQKYDILPCRPRPSDTPDLRYENYQIWDKVQKENFDLGGSDLSWKTGAVDLKIEAELLHDYSNWVRDCRSDLRSEGSLIKQAKSAARSQELRGTRRRRS